MKTNQSKCPVGTFLRMIAKMPFGSKMLEKLKRRRIKSIVESLDEHALRMWQQGHHAFFLIIQGTVLELNHFQHALKQGRLADARTHIDRATILMLGSAAAMRIAGDVNTLSYEKAVVPAMQKASPKFSGSDSHDHAVLVKLYRALEKIKDAFPKEIVIAYARFVNAVDTALKAHKWVCVSQGGGDRQSTGSGSSTKLSGEKTLARIATYVLKLLVPNYKSLQ